MVADAFFRRDTAIERLKTFNETLSLSISSGKINKQLMENFNMTLEAIYHVKTLLIFIANCKQIEVVHFFSNPAEMPNEVFCHDKGTNELVLNQRFPGGTLLWEQFMNM